MSQKKDMTEQAKQVAKKRKQPLLGTVPAAAAPPPPVPVSIQANMSDISYENLDYLIEKSHCEHLIESMLKRKNLRYIWPFNCADHWRRYSHNSDYDHDKEEKLDWRILQAMLKSEEQFIGMDAFVDKVRKMFANAFKCFPNETLLRGAATKTSEMFEARLVKYKALVKEAKERARDVIAKKIAAGQE